MSRFFINGKPADSNGLKKMRNPHSAQVIFLVGPLDKIPLFSKNIISFIISFFLLLLRISPEPLIKKIFIYFFGQ